MTTTPPASGETRRGPERFAVPAQVQDERPSPLRALGAAVALLALLVGVPVALWLLTGPPPVPTGLPDRSDLTQPIGPEFVLGALVVVVWLAWLQFAVCTLVEGVSLVRGGGLPSAVPLSGPTQALARTLISALLVGSTLVGATGAANAAGAPTVDDHAGAGAQTSSTAVAGDASAGSDAGSDAGSGARESQDEQDRTVRRGEGDEQRRAMVPVAGVPADMTDVIGHKVAIVQPPSGHYHDNLWDIAERHLNDGRRWREIYDLNKGRVQPDGQELVLGRLIHPGWVLIMPNDAVGLERVTEAPARADEPVAPPRAPETPPPGEGEQQQASAVAWARDLTAGGLLAAAVLVALVRRRRRGTGADLDPEQQDAEVALRVGADLDRVRWLDAALRSLSAECRVGRIALPPVYAVVVDDDRLELRIAGAHHRAPDGWRVEDDGRRWVRHRADALPAERGHAPYPGLVCLGRDDHGRDVLVCLESADGVVSVQGSPVMSREVVSAIAVQLATAPWADGQRVLGHDLAPTLAGMGEQPVELVSDLDAAFAELTRSGVQQPASQVLTGRLGRAPGATPHYLVMGSPPTEQVEEQLTTLVREGTRGLGVVLSGPMRASRWRATVDDSGRLSLPLLDLEVEAVRLGPDAAEMLAGLFAEAGREQPVEPAGRPPLPPTPPGAGDDSTWTTARVRVGVLGALEMRVTGDIDEARRELAEELVTFLALQDEPVHPSVVGASVWPLGVTAEVRDATIARARDWLGTDADGNHLLQQTENGRLRLSTDVAVDWHAFVALLGRSRESTPREEAELLRRALQLVRGPVLAEAPSRRYSWLVRTGLERHSAALVQDAALRLADLSQDDPPGAGAGVRAALRLVPHSQVLWRRLLGVESQQEDPGALTKVAEEMLVQMRTSGVAIDAETTALLEELLPVHGERPA